MTRVVSKDFVGVLMDGTYCLTYRNSTYVYVYV